MRIASFGDADSAGRGRAEKVSLNGFSSRRRNPSLGETRQQGRQVETDSAPRANNVVRARITDVMEYGNAQDAAGKQSMSFLYERPAQGSTGRQGSVEVVDVPAATVVSIGCRGPQSASAVEEARQRLLEWLSENDAYVPAGPMRVMGYNSPFVPRDRNFFEVQIPVEPATEESSNS